MTSSLQRLEDLPAVEGSAVVLGGQNAQVADVDVAVKIEVAGQRPEAHREPVRSRTFGVHGFGVEAAEALDRTASIYWKLGRLDDSERYYEQCLSIAHDIDNQFAIARGVGGLGLIAWSRGDLDRAVGVNIDQRVALVEKLCRERNAKLDR